MNLTQCELSLKMHFRSYLRNKRLRDDAKAELSSHQIHIYGNSPQDIHRMMKDNEKCMELDRKVLKELFRKRRLLKLSNRLIDEWCG